MKFSNPPAEERLLVIVLLNPAMAVAFVRYRQRRGTPMRPLARSPASPAVQAQRPALHVLHRARARGGAAVITTSSSRIARQIARRTFDGIPSSVSEARAWSSERLQELGVDPPVNLALALSEFATNTVVHTRSGLDGSAFASGSSSPPTGCGSRCVTQDRLLGIRQPGAPLVSPQNTSEGSRSWRRSRLPGVGSRPGPERSRRCPGELPHFPGSPAHLPAAPHTTGRSRDGADGGAGRGGQVRPPYR